MSVAKIQRLSNRQRSHRYNKSDYLIGRSHFDDIESKILVAAPDIDLESRLESRYGASKYPQHPRCSRTIIHMKGAGSTIFSKDRGKDHRFSPKERLQDKCGQMQRCSLSNLKGTHNTHAEGQVCNQWKAVTRDNCNAKSLVPSTRASVVYHLIDVTKTLMREGARLPKSLRVEYIIASGYIKNRFESCHKSNVPDLWFQTSSYYKHEGP